MHKAPLVESKQIEHVVNERVILEAADHPFLVSLKGAYQDKNALYLLQVRAAAVAGVMAAVAGVMAAVAGVMAAVAGVMAAVAGVIAAVAVVVPALAGW